MRKTFLLFAFCTPLFLQAQSLQNGNLEDWLLVKFDNPGGWMSSNEMTIPGFNTANVSKVSPGVTNAAIRLESMAFGPDIIPGIVSNSNDPMLGEGGAPFSQKPTGLSGHFRYNIATNDTARIFIGYKSGGIMYATDIVSLWGSQSTFTLNNYPLPNITASGVTPDTVVMAIMSSDFLGTFVAGSVLEVDNLMFTGPGVTQSINGEFDNWMADSTTTPDDWTLFGTVLRTSDKFQGDYAAKLITRDNGGGLEPSSIEQVFTPSKTTIDTLTGYYKYSTKGNDFANVELVVSKSAGAPTVVNLQLPPVGTYTRFAIPIVTTSNTTNARIMLQSSWDITTIADSSTLYVDSIFIKKQSLGIPGIVTYADITAYPNPTHDELNIRIGYAKATEILIEIYNTSGSKVYSSTAKLLQGETAIPVETLPPGSYIYKIHDGYRTHKGRFFKD